MEAVHIRYKVLQQEVIRRVTEGIAVTEPVNEMNYRNAGLLAISAKNFKRKVKEEREITLAITGSYTRMYRVDFVAKTMT